jgi:hypothetical protein
VPTFATSLEQQGVAKRAQTMRFDEGNDSGALALSWKGRWIARATKLFHRANLAARIADGANERSQIHHRVLKIARMLPGNQLCRRFP